MIASSVADLHGDQARDRNNIQRATALDAKGNEIPGVGSPPGGNQHDMLTGSDSDGRAFIDGYDHTCNNWTADAMSVPQANPNVPADRVRAMLGHSDRSGGANTSWNAAHLSQGCTKQSLINTGSAGRFYCFAVNEIALVSSQPATRAASRLFAGPNQYPPTSFAAYGILAFPSRPTPNDRDRYKMFCEAYMAVFSLAWELGIPDSQQMVTVWPMAAESMADDLNKAPRRDTACDAAVDNYGLAAADRAFNDATQAGASFNGRGPFLLAWSPPTQKGQASALVLGENLSNVTTPNEAKIRLLTWKSEILKNPELWRGGWNVELIRITIREFVDQFGQIIEIFGIVR